MKNLREQVSPYGSFHSYYVSSEEFSHSNHKDLKCVECHTKGYAVFPHTGKTNPNCIECHQSHPSFLDGSKEREDLLQEMKVIDREFLGSIHRERSNEKFECGRCHNPHTFTGVLGNKMSHSKRVQWSNAMCISCHTSEKKINEIKSEDYQFKELTKIHSWLPSLKYHWTNVRCVDCHADFNGVVPDVAIDKSVPELKRAESEGKGRFSHKILAKDDAIRDCAQCHSSTSILNSRIYQMRMREVRNEHGFINSVLWNDAYIIGATRNRYMDLFSFLLLSGGVLGMAVHATLRYMAYHKRLKAGKEKKNGV